MPTPRLIAFASESGQMADKRTEQEEGDRQEVVFTVLQGDTEERKKAADGRSLLVEQMLKPRDPQD